ncbi:MAG: substrate-binding domain-containing protein [Bacteroidaceae bacterium]|nr:substrate-binding domain-containing protein [Bacteroidaceae bacterium]
MSVKNLLLIIVASLLSGCMQPSRYKVAVLMTFNDEWTAQMEQIMGYEADQYPDIELAVYTQNVDDTPAKKIRLLDSLLHTDVSLLAVGSDYPELEAGIAKAHSRGIPVAVMGPYGHPEDVEMRVNIDDVQMAADMGRYVVSLLKQGGHILEVTGPIQLPYARRRYEGFHAVFDTCSHIRLTTVHADYSLADARRKVAALIPDLEEPVDLVVGYNDRLALGARQALLASPKTRDWKVRYTGVDCLINDSIGLGRVEDGTLTASMLWGTGGEILIRTAVKLLQGKPYEREIVPVSGLVTRENTRIIRSEWQKTVEKAQLMRQANATLKQQKERATRLSMALVILVLLTLAGLYLYRLNMKYNRVLLAKNQELQKEKERVEMQRDQLEQERERLLELQIKAETPTDENVQAEKDDAGNQAFRKRLNEIIEQNLDNEELTVEMIGEQMRLGRVQLYRRTKAACGMSPNEYLRATRLNHAHHLLQTTTMNVSEVSYAVGYSSPRYFAKCYKNQFGCNPSELK